MVNNSLIQPVKPGPVLKTTIFSENHWSNHRPLDVEASHSASFDHLRRPETLRTAIANQVRFVFHTAAYWLMHRVRAAIPPAYPLARAELTHTDPDRTDRRRARAVSMSAGHPKNAAGGA